MLIAQRIRLRTIRSAMIRLIDLVEREIGDVDVGNEARFKGGADAAETAPVDTFEEVVGFDFRGAGVA